MKIIQTVSDLESFLFEKKLSSQVIGFVPTMGALHLGHGSLIEKALLECDVVLVSVFVNPTQFNNTADFEKYPITVEKDLDFLERLNIDAVFLPNLKEVYPDNFQLPAYEIGSLGLVMEGKHRPGHFDGVVQVVYRLFDIIKPNKAYFGLKDFQQLAIIKNMTKHFNLPIEIIPCKTIREKDGLAMSSRNIRLSEGQRFEALFINQSLNLAKALAAKMSPKVLKKQIEELYAASSLRLEYVEFVDPLLFEVLTVNWVKGAVACIAAYVGEIRLIDNMVLID